MSEIELKDEELNEVDGGADFLYKKKALVAFKLGGGYFHGYIIFTLTKDGKNYYKIKPSEPIAAYVTIPEEDIIKVM